MSRQVTTDTQGRLILRFTFDKRLVDLVKTLPGRRWNATSRYWSVPGEAVVQTLEMLEGEGFAFDSSVIELYQSIGGERPIDTPAEAPSQDWSVSRLNEQVQQVLQTAFPVPLWIIGEISGFNKSRHKKHVSFQLVERRKDGSTVSQLGATLFDRTRQAIEKKLNESTSPFQLEDEIEVRFSVRVELYVPWGSYRVIVEDLDIAYTLGEAARRREEILKTLRAEGLDRLNPALPFPDLPLRVALITSLGSDAYNDVIRTLEESGYAFDVTAFGARVQGHATEPSVLNALDAARNQCEQFDVLLICRGGGSRTDLAWFDNEALGRAVAEFPLPVVIGIGHEQDRSVLDELARRAKTPTAAAQILTETVRASFEQRLALRDSILNQASRALQRANTDQFHRGQRLAAAVQSKLREARLTNEHTHQRIGRAAIGTIRTAAENLGRAQTGLPRRAKEIFLREYAKLDARAARLRALDPARVLERGYALLRGESGNRIGSVHDAPEGSPVFARLSDGTLALRSLGPETDAKEK